MWIKTVTGITVNVASIAYYRMTTEGSTADIEANLITGDLVHLFSGAVDDCETFCHWLDKQVGAVVIEATYPTRPLLPV